jgi:tetratricopeptide (TPR) repeat protein
VKGSLLLKEKTKRLVEMALFNNDIGRAANLSENALANGEVHEMLFSIAALWRQQMGDARGAVDLHRTAVQLAPENPSVLAAAADSLRFTGQLNESLSLFDEALAQDPMLVAAWYGRALALESTGALDEARRSYRRVAELAPATAPGFAGLATTSAQLGDIDEARKYAAEAYRLAPDEPLVKMALARSHFASGDDALAIDLLRDLAGRIEIHGQDAVSVLTLLGDVYDRQGNNEHAFNAYQEANFRFAEMHAGPNAPPIARKRVEDIDKALASMPAKSWNAEFPRGDMTATQHIFLTGFPRSGTTLVEQALASLPDVVTLEEAPTLDDAGEHLTGAGIAALPQVPEDEAQHLRAAYWRRVEEAGVDVAGKIFVDMDPFKGPALPLIARLFPKAKIIIMRRDPRDVIWSCFRRSFVFSSAAYEFTTLERAARHYDAVMQTIERSLAIFPLASLPVQYEALVKDFDHVTREICDFAGIPWAADVHNFGKTAQRGRVRTASAAQVRGQLFDGSGQWRAYADKIRPILPILEPWLAAD